MSYSTTTYFPTNMGGANFSPYNYQTAVPMQQNQQSQPNTGSIMTVYVHSDDEVLSYPVAAGTTVQLINFSSNKFWLKSTSTAGIPEPIREFEFKETTAPPVQSSGVSRQEFDDLSKKIDKLISDLGGGSNG